MPKATKNIGDSASGCVLYTVVLKALPALTAKEELSNRGFDMNKTLRFRQVGTDRILAIQRIVDPVSYRKEEV